MNQVEKANLFQTLHAPGEPIVLYNIWDAGSAAALTNAGAKAVATGSASVAAAQGYDDGEAIPMDFLLQLASRIVESVDVPVSVDFEGAYAAEPELVAANVAAVIRTGAVGINFEDRVVSGDGLYPLDLQVQRIKAIREEAASQGIPFFINARTDLFLESNAEQHHSHVYEAIERAAAYADAGASGFFIPGLANLDFIHQIVSASRLPVNVLMMGELNSIHEVAEVGVGRASYGPVPYRKSMEDLVACYRELK